MDRKEITEKIKKIVKENLPGFEDKEIEESTQINTDAALDSMSFTYIMCKIEAEFNIRIPGKKWQKMSTLGDVVDAVEAELKKKK